MRNKEKPKPNCPACFIPIPSNSKEVRFWRVHHYDKTYYRKTGIICKCGYIVSNDNY